MATKTAVTTLEAVSEEQQSDKMQILNKFLTEISDRAWTVQFKVASF